MWARAMADAWEAEAAARESRAPGVPDPVAASMRTQAADLRAKIEEVERESAYLTVPEYAARHDVSEQSVRRWCLAGELNAERSLGGDWRIPQNALRRARSA